MIHARVFDPEYNAGTGTYAPATFYRRSWAPTQGRRGGASRPERLGMCHSDGGIQLFKTHHQLLAPIGTNTVLL